MSSPQIILVTGANQGLGFEAALQLSKLPGYHVLVGARDTAKGAAAVDKIAAAGAQSKISLLVIDVSSDASIENAKAEVEQKFGKLDVLVNNAAIHIDGAPGGVPTRELLRKTYETNVFGVAATINAFVPLLEKAAFPRIVNVSSTLGSLARVSMTDQFWSDMQWPAYNSAKSALNGLTVYFAQTLRNKGFRVISLDPGYNSTNMNGNDSNGQDPSVGAAGIVRVAVAEQNSEFKTGEFRDQHGEIVPW